MHVNSGKFLIGESNFEFNLGSNSESNSNSNSNLKLKSKFYKDFAKVIEPFDKKASRFYTEILAINISDKDANQLFVGYKNSTPVFIGSLFFAGELVGVFDLITEAYKK